MCASRNKFFSDSVEVLNILEHLLQPCFGPDGLAILLEGADGHITCLHNGCQSISSLNYVNPAGLLVVQATNQLHRVIGDGSKKFILMVSAALRELSLYSWRDLNAVRQALAKMGSNLTSVLISSLITSQERDEDSGLSVTLNGSNLDRKPLLQDMCLYLARTCLGNRYSAKTGKKILQIALHLALPPSNSGQHQTMQALRKNIEHVQRNFDEVVTSVPGVPFSECRVIEGFIIERSFIIEPPSLPLEHFRLLLLFSGLDLEEGDGNMNFSVSFKDNLWKVVDGLTNFKKRIVESLSHHSIRLVLTARKVDPVMAQFMRLHSIGVVQMVPKETLRYIAESCGVHPISTPTDVLHLDESSWIDGKFCSYETIGCHRVISLQCEWRSPLLPTPAPHSVILCSVTTGLCRQLAKQISQILRVIAQWSKEVEEEGLRFSALRGGGAWEVAVARNIEKHILKQKLIRGSTEWIACKALQQAFLSTPLTLLKNTKSSSHARDKIKTFDMIFGSDSLKKNVPLGVDIAQGCLRPLDGSGSSLSSVLEPYWSQALLVQSVCNFLNKLMGIDMVVRTSQIISSTIQNKKLTEQDSDSDEDT